MADRDQCVTISVRVAVIVFGWSAGVGLVVLQTVGYADVLGRWGAVFCLAAGTLTVVHVTTRQGRLLREAFDLGAESERSKVTALR